ncbi:MAG: helix-turn-helix domain-containing protein [Ktedonobacteraceae bacterium]
MFQYRIFPTKKQAQKLNETLDECRRLYNHLLENRKHAYEQTGKGLSCYEQQATYPLLKQQRPTLEHVHSQVLQNVAVRLDLAFKAFLDDAKLEKSLVSLCAASSAVIERNKCCWN